MPCSDDTLKVGDVLFDRRPGAVFPCNPECEEQDAEVAELRNIVHVDDDDDILSLTKMSLEYFGGMTVTQFRSGREALDKIEANGVDLLLLDVMMPDMDGLSLFRRLRELPGLQDVRAVFMTAKAEHLNFTPSRKDGILGVISKPFDTIELPQTIRALWSDAMPEGGQG